MHDVENEEENDNDNENEIESDDSDYNDFDNINIKKRKKILQDKNIKNMKKKFENLNGQISSFEITKSEKRKVKIKKVHDLDNDRGEDFQNFDKFPLSKKVLLKNVPPKNVPQIFLGNKRKYAMNSNILLNGKSDNKHEFNVSKCVNSKTKTFNDIIEILDDDDSNDNYSKKSQNNVFNSNHNNNNSNNSNDSNYNKSQNNDFDNIFKKEGHIAKKCFHLDDNNNNKNKNNFNNNKNIVNNDKNKNNNNTDYSKVFLNSNSKEIISNHDLSFPLPSSLPRGKVQGGTLIMYVVFFFVFFL